MPGRFPPPGQIIAKASRGGQSVTKREDAMVRKGLYAIALTSLICSAASAGDIHQVVTTLDPTNKSTTLFDSNVPLEIGKSAFFGSPIPARRDFRRKTPASGLSAFRRRPTAPCCALSNFLRSMTPSLRVWTPIS
jgi:hypothetical protein